MYYPKTKLHQLYSVNFDETIDILFDDLDKINLSSLDYVLKNRIYDNIIIIPDLFRIDTKKQIITIFGTKLNNTTYIVNSNGYGENLEIIYDTDKKNIIVGLEYLYHMCKNLDPCGF